MIDVSQVRSLSGSDLEKIRDMVETEWRRRVVMATAHSEAARAAEEYRRAVRHQDAKDITALDQAAVIGPGEAIIVDGTEWVNRTNAWLSPFTAGPVEYLAGWSHVIR